MILAIDTATRWLGLALYDGTAVLAEQGWRSHNTQTVELVPAIQQMLTRLELTTADLRALAVTIGPGSYTGLRIGLAVAKGVAIAHQLPIVAVNTLDLTAASAERALVVGQLMAVIEAGRTRVTIAPYAWQKGWQRTAEPQNTTWAEWLPTLENPTTFVGEITAEAAKLMRQTGKHFHALPPVQNVRRAALLAQMGWLHHRQGLAVPAVHVVPLY